MIKLIFKIIGIVIAVLCFILTIFLLFAHQGYGINLLKDTFSDGFFNGIKNFFVGIWDGFKFVCGL